jgi:hypothetical protein
VRNSPGIHVIAKLVNYVSEDGSFPWAPGANVRGGMDTSQVQTSYNIHAFHPGVSRCRRCQQDLSLINNLFVGEFPDSIGKLTAKAFGLEQVIDPALDASDARAIQLRVSVLPVVGKEFVVYLGAHSFAQSGTPGTGFQEFARLNERDVRAEENRSHDVPYSPHDVETQLGFGEKAADLSCDIADSGIHFLNGLTREERQTQDVVVIHRAMQDAIVKSSVVKEEQDSLYGRIVGIDHTRPFRRILVQEPCDGRSYEHGLAKAGRPSNHHA